MRRKNSGPLRWAPTREQADWLCDALTARIDRAKIAAVLGIDTKTLMLYLERLKAAAEAPYS